MPGTGAGPPEPPDQPPVGRRGPGRPASPARTAARRNPPDALFCESCGYDFTTGSMPRPLTPPDRRPRPRRRRRGRAGGRPDRRPGRPAGTAGRGSGFDWVAEVWIDPAWYEAQESPDPLPSAGLPDGRAAARPLAAGRPGLAVSRNIHPDDRLRHRLRRQPAAGAADDRRHPLVGRGPRVGQRHLRRPRPAAPLPEDPIAVGGKHELAARRPGLRRRLDPAGVRPATEEAHRDAALTTAPGEPRLTGTRATLSANTGQVPAGAVWHRWW